eukprot:6178510-Pleurochrysis_carterae.AAC.2
MDMLSLTLDAHRVLSALQRCWSIGAARSRPATAAADERNEPPLTITPPARTPVVARGPTACAHALLVGRERRSASRYARGTGRQGCDLCSRQRLHLAHSSACVWPCERAKHRRSHCGCGR